MLFGFAQVVRHHFLPPHERNLGHPTQVGFGFAGVAQWGFLLRGA